MAATVEGLKGRRKSENLTGQGQRLSRALPIAGSTTGKLFPSKSQQKERGSSISYGRDCTQDLQGGVKRGRDESR